MALLMLLLIGYALLLLLPPVAVGAWELGAERNRHSVWTLPFSGSLLPEFLFV